MELSIDLFIDTNREHITRWTNGTNDVFLWFHSYPDNAEGKNIRLEYFFYNRGRPISRYFDYAAVIPDDLNKFFGLVTKGYRYGRKQDMNVKFRQITWQEYEVLKKASYPGWPKNP